MKYVICHGDNIQARNVREELTVGNDVVYVPVRVLVCQTCGELNYEQPHPPGGD
jgi:YgiT-type zinc finger domain-containing protein